MPPQQNDPWADAAKAYKSGSGAAVQPSATQTPGEDWKVWQAGDGDAGPAAEPGMLDQLANWGAKTFPNISKADAAHSESDALNPNRGTAPELSRILVNAGSTALRGAAAMPAGIVDWAKQGFDPEQDLHPIQYAQKRLAASAAQPGRIVQPGQPVPQPTEENYADETSNLLGQGALGLATGETVGGLLKLPGAAKSFVRGDIDAPIAGSEITPRERYQAAKRVGVNLPPAQATNSRILKPLDWINSEGLLSAPLHEGLKARNTAALTGTAEGLASHMSPFDAQTGGELVREDLHRPFVELQDRAHGIMNEMSPLGREQGGTQLQSLLQANQRELETSGGEQEQAIRDQYGDLPIRSYDPMRSTARTVLEQNEPVDSLVPGLAQNHTRKILQSIGRFGEEPAEGATAPMRPRIGDAMNIRSRLLDLKGNNPELVRGSADADLDRMIGATHQTIADTLPAEGQQDWLKANEIWKDMKDTYDNPSSPFYNAVRTPNPSTLVEGIGGTSPESVRALRSRAGDEGVGIVGRGVGEKLLGTTANGEYDLGNLGSRMERMPEEGRNELFGNNRHEQLRRIGQERGEMQPFEKAAFSDNPESLVQGIGPETSAGVRMLREMPMKPEGAAGPLAPRVGAQGMGAIRRGVFEKLLGNTADGGYNFPTFAGKLARMNEGYRGELFGPHEGTINDIATTARTLDRDFNRSGSGKLAQKLIETGSLPSGVPLLQYPLGKIMTSPGVADWLMRDSARSNPFFAPAAGITAATSQKRRPRQ